MTDPEFRDPSWETGLGEYQENELVIGPDGRYTRRKFLALGGMAVGAAAASGPLVFGTADAMVEDKKKGLPYKANFNVSGHVVFWHHWASPMRRNAIREVIKSFEHIYKKVHVTEVPFPYGENWVKVRAAVAAGGQGTPDTIIADRPSFWFDARNHVYIPITKFVHRDHINGGKIFWPFTWHESIVRLGGKNQIIGLPYETDIRVNFFNRAQFSDAGLNVNQAPKLWSDLPHYADKLDVKGKVIGFWPLEGFDLTAWPWDNNTDFQNAKMYPTLNTPKMIQTAEWMKGWVDRYGGTPGYNLVRSQDQPGRNDFQSGVVSMAIDTPGMQAATLFYGIQFHPRNGKNIFPYWGAGLVPYNTGGKPVSFGGGFAMAIPNNPHRSAKTEEATWEFMKYLTLVGQLPFEAAAGLIPTVKSMNKSPLLTRTMHWHVFMEAFKYVHPKIKNFYDDQFPGDVIGNAQTAILKGTSAKSALDTAQNQALANMKRNGGP